MPKRIVQLWVDTYLVDLAKAKGINMSQLFNNVLQELVESPERLEVMDDAGIQKDIIRLTDELNSKKALIKQIDEKKHGKILKEEEVKI